MGAGRQNWPKPGFTLIDRFTLAGILAGKKFDKRIREFQWAFYAQLANQRAQVRDRLHKALLAAAVARFEFKSWCRITKYRWVLKPLSAGGSLGFPGGRFNVGHVDPTFSKFPALYMSKDYDTAYSEVFGQGPNAKGPLTPQEMALIHPTSLGIFRLNGKVQTVLDLHYPDRLQEFVDLIKSFTLTPDLHRTARDLAREMKLQPQKLLVTSVKELISVVLMENWRELPIQVGVPSTSQLFGQLASQAGIEAIIYPSKFDSLPCIAVFPELFSKSSSFVELDGDPPRKDIATRLDRDSWENLSK